MTGFAIIGIWLTAVCLAGIVVLATAWVREKRAERDAEERRLDEGIKEIRAQELAERTVHIAPSPVLAQAPWRPEPAAVRMAAARHGNQARLEQQRRHPAVVAAMGAGPLHVRPQRARPQLATPPGPLTTEFNAIVARNTGTAPKGRGPREADVRMRRTEQPPAAWAQDALPLEIGA